MSRLFRVVIALAFGFVLADVGFRNADLAAQPKGKGPEVPKGYPTLTTATNVGGKPGSTVEVVLTGTNLAGATGVWTSFGGKVTVFF